MESGIILDGKTEVGTFESIEKKNFFGLDSYKITNVSILHSYFSIPNRKTKKLNVITGILGADNVFTLSKNYGKCEILPHNNIWVSDKRVIIDLGDLIQCV